MGNDNRNSMMMPIIGGVMALGATLVLGAYGYTWSEMKSEQEEKHQWRTEHQQVLDKKFEEVKQGQEKLVDAITKSTDDTKDILKQMLEEQRKSNENMSKQKRVR